MCRWGGLSLDKIRGYRKVAGDGAVGYLNEQICTRALACGIACVVLQPFGEGIVPAIEGVGIVAGCKRVDPIAHADLIRLRRATSAAALASLGASSGSSRDATSWSK